MRIFGIHSFYKSCIRTYESNHHVRDRDIFGLDDPAMNYSPASEEKAPKFLKLKFDLKKLHGPSILLCNQFIYFESIMNIVFILEMYAFVLPSSVTRHFEQNYTVLYLKCIEVLRI
jgi:hypothetical protein